MSARNHVRLEHGRAIKECEHAATAAREASYYALVPWAAPALLEVGEDYLVTEALPCASEHLDVRPVQQLRALLARLHRTGVNHRDVHVGNVVLHPERGPLLIDWEHATREVGELSYDLYGPRPDTVPQPYWQHGQPMWWGAPSPSSIRRAWGRRRKRGRK